MPFDAWHWVDHTITPSGTERRFADITRGATRFVVGERESFEYVEVIFTVDAEGLADNACGHY